MSALSANKSCWNCRDRKIRCDRNQPGCQNCSKSNKSCPGYGLRLSWPRDGDKRRALKGGNSKILPVQVQSQGFINSTSWDVALSNALLANEPHDNHLNHRSLSLIGNLSINTENILLLDKTLGRFNHSFLAEILSPKDEENELYDLLLRMSLDDGTASTKALRHAISALSYLQIQQQTEATFHYQNAIKTLSHSIGQQQGVKDGLQNIATSMLLNMYGRLSCSGNAVGWTVFFCGSKRITKVVYDRSQAYEGDAATLLDWVFYHDVFYKFSIRHWAQRQREHKELAAEEKIISKEVYSPLRRVILPSLGCSLELLDNLTRVFDLVHDRNNPSYLSEQHQKALDSLSLRLQNVHQKYGSNGSTDAEAKNLRIHQVAELYRLAGLIYLDRVARGSPISSPKSLTWIQEALQILRQLHTCERPFPLFVIALEARDDNSRALMLKILAETKNQFPYSAVSSVQQMVEAAWTQDDLSVDQELDSLLKYNAVISAYKIPPSFA